MTNTPTFAVLDGAGIPDLLDRLHSAPALEFACLFEGDIESDIAEVAPYLVRVLPGSELADWLLAGWGECRGIFAQAPAALELSALRRHFRKLSPWRTAPTCARSCFGFMTRACCVSNWPNAAPPA